MSDRKINMPIGLVKQMIEQKNNFRLTRKQLEKPKRQAERQKDPLKNN